MKRLNVLIGCMVAVAAAICLAQTLPGPQPREPNLYRVTRWPTHEGPDKQYTDAVERHLNRMASEGWRFHSTLAGQHVRMMVFERAARP
jgi:hypothetical protein